uniref:Uncharacterized protein n=1 Tax=Castor canadensis TaxID=51338 RepID=A0A8C0XBZ0_CASCN
MKSKIHPRRCALTEEEIARQLKLQGRDESILMQSGYEGWWTHRWFIELALVVDHNRFLYWGSNISNVLQELFIILNEANSLLISVDVDVTLLGLEIWNKGNPIVQDDVENLLGDFCYWKATTLNSRIQNDIAHLFVQQHFGIYLGYAIIGSVCVPYFNCGVDQLMGEDMYIIGHVVAHEIGHNLGMVHYDNLCTCGQKSCIMAAVNNNFRRFSNCSYSPNPLDIVPLKHCGNGVIEDGEECDCGSLKLCTNDPCCMTGCMLKYGADCASGLCCNDCEFMPPGTICREKNNECDLPEWCNGTSPNCPEDVYVQEGFPCPGNGYCYEKRCNNHDKQCRQTFGINARSASQSCYMEMNTRGDRFGNCGINHNTYIKCNSSDILCGRIQCENVTAIPFLREHSTVHQTHLNGVTCWGTDYHWGMTIPDVGEVKDGTEGPNHGLYVFLCVCVCIHLVSLK